MRRLRLRPLPAFVVAVVALVLALGGAAFATIPDSAGVIHACYQVNRTGQLDRNSSLRLIDPSGSGTQGTKGCTPHELALDWNHTGPRGPAGLPGPKGDTGPQGPQGDAGRAGSAGADGKTVLNGVGAPAANLGSNGDFYIDTSANAIYGPKTDTGWGNATSLVGPKGPTGQQGATGDTGATGPQGPAGGALAYARVNYDGTVDIGNSKNVTAANVSSPLPGVYCFTGLSFTPHNLVATLGVGNAQQLTGDLDDVFRLGACNTVPGTVAWIVTSDSTGANRASSFYVSFN